VLISGAFALIRGKRSEHGWYFLVCFGLLRYILSGRMSCWFPADLVSLGKHLDHLGGVDGLVKNTRLGASWTVCDRKLTEIFR
jgi:hypothetical protein